MAMRTASPWWASLLFGVGLLAIFLGERLLAGVEGIGGLFTVGGVILVLGVTAARGFTTARTTGARRNVERTLLACHLATVLALVLYMLTTSWGPQSLHTEHASGALTAIWVVLIIASIVPVLVIELSLGIALRDNFDVEETEVDAGVEYFRVRELAWSGLTIAFVMSLAMVTCQVSKERNAQRDVSYFKTSAPGESTVNIVKASAEPIRVYVFFPNTGEEVKDQVVSYFEELNAQTGKVDVQALDRLSVEGDNIGGKYKVPPPRENVAPKDDKGTIIIARGQGDKEKFFPIEVPADFETARKSSGKLRHLDKDVNTILTKVMREKRKAYLIKGHGEATDPESMPADVKDRIGRRATFFRRYLGDLNYEAKDIGIGELVKDVPDDAQIVVLLGPMTPLDPAEWEALDRYLERGGHLLVVVDPITPPTLGGLEARLGLQVIPGTLVDDTNYYVRRHAKADRKIISTRNMQNHATTTQLMRPGQPLFLLEACALKDVDVTKGTPAKKVNIIQSDSAGTAWVETDSNLEFDAATEKKGVYHVGVVEEGPRVGDKDGFRAMVLCDLDSFADAPIGIDPRSGALVTDLRNLPLFVDTIRWLGGEEIFAGEIVQEEDVKIQHTKGQDAVWFTLTTIGAPVLVLALGLVGTWARRKRSKKAADQEVVP
jgi:gliding motility-associatede transport system auxiliary component